MNRFHLSVRRKGIWLLLFCSFCIALKVYMLKFWKPYAFSEIVADKYYLMNSETVTNRDDKNISSNIGRTNVSKENQSRDIFPGRKNESSVPAMKQNESQHQHYNSSSDIKVGILIPSSTRNIKQPVLEKLSLMRICLPSIYKTIEMQYIYMIYVGIDKGDYLESVKDKLETMVGKLNVKTVVTPGRTFTKTVNAIAREAYQDGMDYLVRINDDSSFESLNWTSKGISVLQNYTPPNIGVAGPTCRQGGIRILTHDMVHRTHLEIFDFYYPPYFDNWWADTWITQVYKPERLTKLPSWLVKHHLSAHEKRYIVDHKQHIRLQHFTALDKERLTKYLSTYMQ